MTDKLMKLLSGDILEEDVYMTLSELCRSCHLTTEQIFELVEHGVIEPQGRLPAHWRFHGINVRRIRRAQRLERDLGVNLAGAALVLDLVEELEQLRQRVRRFEN
ncbi:chaperone modulatory protein CbpM [Nitrosomonas sp. Nm51]|uniref:chaperone modulator CbpM n=1 Tax=Nitrosomonas sp. Nm51 TaxID=133720 RepID=UPI0008BD1F30|nr:chaperone modulator CbpM [Nitrosomonas sp. Nm51]SER25120.1 chaperone modulatory protein CbpM [Nitrosomonas sp. Nm51]